MLDVFRHFRIEEDQMLQRPVCQHRLRVFVEPASGNEDRFRAGVGKDVIDLVQCLSGVDRNVDRAETQNREVGYRPLGSVLGKQCDPVSRTDAETRQTERDVLDSLDESLPRGCCATCLRSR